MKTIITVLIVCFTLSLQAQFQYTVTSIPYTPYSYDTGDTAFLYPPLNDDGYSLPIALPFTFNFYGTDYTDLIIGANGLVSFDLSIAGGPAMWSLTAADTCPSYNLPNYAIFSPFHDLDPTVNGNIFYNTYGSLPNREFVISWDSVPLFSTDSSSLFTTQQIVLYETSNIIDVNMQEKPICLSWNGGNAVVGIQEHYYVGLAAPGRNTGQWTASNEAWRFFPPCSYNNHVPQICMVTVDSLSQNNIIIWDKTPYSITDSFFVYREITTNNYQRIGAVPYDSLSQFADTVRNLYFPNTGNPNAGTYRYRLQMHDTCGYYSQLSPYHNTIFIINTGGSFSWQEQYSLNPVDAYVLMRDDNSNGNWHAVASVAGTQQAISDPDYSTYQGTASWRIQTQWSIVCNPTLKSGKSFNTSFSNIVGGLSSVDETGQNSWLKIYPNPAANKIIIDYDGIQNLNLSVYNVVGQLLMQREVNKSSNEIDISSLLKGMYILKVSCADWTVQRKLVKE
jgi:hypothetical protein